MWQVFLARGNRQTSSEKLRPRGATSSLFIAKAQRGRKDRQELSLCFPFAYFAIFATLRLITGVVGARAALDFPRLLGCAVAIKFGQTQAEPPLSEFGGWLYIGDGFLDAP